MNAIFAVGMMLVAQTSGIRELAIHESETPGVAYRVTVEGARDLSDKDVEDIKNVLQLLRRSGGPGTPKGELKLLGGDCVVTERRGKYLFLDQESGPKVLLQTGEVRDIGKGVPALRRMYVKSNLTVELWFDYKTDFRYISHVVEVTTAYMERTHHGGGVISMDVSFTRNNGYRVVTLTDQGSE